MLSARTIASLLLLVYGVPTAIGPAWHDCFHAAIRNCDERIVSEHTGSTNVECAGPVCGCNCQGSIKTFPGSSKEDNSVSRSRCEHCAIEAFYAHNVLYAGSPLLIDTGVGGFLKLPACAIPDSASVFAIARGPPTRLLVI